MIWFLNIWGMPSNTVPFTCMKLLLTDPKLVPAFLRIGEYLALCFLKQQHPLQDKTQQHETHETKFVLLMEEKKNKKAAAFHPPYRS